MLDRVFLPVLVAMLGAAACRTGDGVPSDCLRGEGAVTTQVLSVPSFEGIDVTGAASVKISQGAIQEVRAVGHPNIIEKVERDVSGSTWDIGLEEGCYRDYELAIEITVPSLKQLGVSGSGTALMNDFANQGELEVSISGSGDITVNALEGVTLLSTSLSGSGNFKARAGITPKTSVLDSSGSGNYLGFEVHCEACVVASSGSGNSQVSAATSLDVTLSGSANVSYRGEPRITKNVTGSGRLIKVN